jgi:glycerophosphoryl diester phosphodiesterase
MFRAIAALLALALSAVPVQAEFLIALHRGVMSPDQAENSAAAVRRAVAGRARIVEIDLRLTADGEMVVMHDPTVDRTTNGRGQVSSMTLAQLKALDIGGGEPVLTFGEALDLVAGSETRLLLDLKQGGRIDPKSLLAVAAAHRASQQIIIGARSTTAARAYRALDPKIEIVGFIPTLSDADGFAAAGANAIRLWPQWIFAAQNGCNADSSACPVTRLQQRGLKVWTTADTPANPAKAENFFRRLVASGVDVVLTDSARNPVLVNAAGGTK